MSITADHASLEVYGAAAVDRTITQAEYLRVNPVDQTSTALNNTGSRIVLEVNATDSFLYPKDSYIHVEGTIVKADNSAYAVGDDIGFTHNGLMHCFREVEYLINDRQVERLGNVGQATTMLGTLKYSQDFAISQGESQLWVKDTLVQQLEMLLRLLTTLDTRLESRLPKVRFSQS